MALVFDASVGTATSNSYASVEAAQAIIDATPNATAWGSDVSTQQQALVQATTLLDALVYQGVKSYLTQAKQFPRSGIRDPDYGEVDAHIPGTMLGNWGIYLDFTLIPKRVERACVMLALEILRAGTADIWGVDKTANISKKTIDTIATEFVGISDRRFGLRVYPSVWREIYPLTMAAVPQTVERA